MKEQDNPTVHKLMRAFVKFNRAEWAQKMVAGHKPSDIKLLFCIRRSSELYAGGMKISDISRILHVTSPTVTQQVKYLESIGLVERKIDPEDRRAVRIVLTDKGMDLTSKAFAQYEEKLKGLIDYLGEEDTHRLAELLGKVFQYFKGDQECSEEKDTQSEMRE